jgi:hypothetical protein
MCSVSPVDLSPDRAAVQPSFDLEPQPELPIALPDMHGNTGVPASSGATAQPPWTSEAVRHPLDLATTRSIRTGGLANMYKLLVVANALSGLPCTRGDAFLYPEKDALKTAGAK